MYRSAPEPTPSQRLYTHLSDFFTASASWLVPALWLLSISFVILDATVPDGRLEWSHLANWSALAAVSVNCHALVRHIIGRLTEIIALWREDIEIHHTSPVPAASEGPDENVVPLLRTATRTGTGPS